ncbi:leucine-rich repeat-containing protein 18-like [Diretmus argenteus]
MPKWKGAGGKKVTLKMAKKAMRITPDGWRRLNLSNMGIATFPKCLLKLSDVDELDLSRNLIQKLPDDIGSLLSLRWLDLHSNKLAAVPESIGKLVGLIHLNLCNNRLTSAGLPSTLGSLSNLKSLNLGMNCLDALPPTMAALTDLQELGLFDNLFVKRPEFVNSLSNLTKLNTKRNPLSYAQRDEDSVPKSQSEPGEKMYLVPESSLCTTCHQRCKEEEQKMAGKGVRKRTYSGLITPNSVAKTSQDVWRIRAEEQNDKTATD